MITRFTSRFSVELAPQMALLSALLLICYFPMLRITASLLMASDDMAHGVAAPLIAAYIVWEKRALFFSLPVKPSAAGLGLIVLASFAGVIAAAGGSTTFSRCAFLVSLAGALLATGGWAFLKPFLFPISLLIFTFPVPFALYSELTLPLQLLASRWSQSVMELAGLTVFRTGNVLHLAHRTLSVAEACSGLKSLITLSFFCIVYAYFLETRASIRAVILLAAPLAAIALNVIRIALTGILSKAHPEITSGFYHELLGWLCLGLGVAMVVAAHRISRWIIVRQEAV